MNLSVLEPGLARGSVPRRACAGVVLHHDAPVLWEVPAPQTAPMIDLARECAAERSGMLAVHDGLMMSILPQVRRHLRFAFRKICLTNRLTGRPKPSPALPQLNGASR